MTSPEGRGFFLEPDGTGRIGGSDPSLDGGFLRWDVREGKLRLLPHGEEGEHGDYEVFAYTIVGNKLSLNQSFRRERNFQAVN